MKTENKRFGIPGKGLIAVCILAIIVSASSIITTYRMQKMASIIYEHPYTVSNESRATRSRLLLLHYEYVYPAGLERTGFTAIIE